MKVFIIAVILVCTSFSFCFCQAAAKPEVVWDAAGKIIVNAQGTNSTPFVITGVNASKGKAAVVSVVPSCATCVTIQSFTSAPVSHGKSMEIRGVVTNPRYGKKTTLLSITCDVGGNQTKSFFTVIGDSGPKPVVFDPPQLSWNIGDATPKYTSFVVDLKNFKVMDINFDGEGFEMAVYPDPYGAYAIAVAPKDPSKPANAALQVAVKNYSLGGIDVLRCRTTVGTNTPAPAPK